MNTLTKLDNLRLDLQDAENKLVEIAQLKQKSDEELLELESSLKEIHPEVLVKREITAAGLERAEKRYTDLKARLEAEIAECEAELKRASTIEALTTLSENCDKLFSEAEELRSEINEMLEKKVAELLEKRAKVQALRNESWPLLNALGFSRESQHEELESFLTELDIQDGRWREPTGYCLWWQRNLPYNELSFGHAINVALNRGVRPNDPTPPFAVTKLEDL
jgi:chromosome segregation ATPase